MQVNTLTFSLIILMLLPPFVYVVGQASSLAVGLLASLFAIIMLQKKLVYKIQLRSLTDPLIFSCILIICKSIVDVSMLPSLRSLTSILSLLILIATSWVIASSISRLSVPKLKKLFRVLTALCILILIIFGANKVFILNYSSYPANVFPFAEPSHFAITCGPIIAVGTLFSNWSEKVVILIIVIAASIILPNLSLLIISLIIFLIAMTQGPKIVKLIIFSIGSVCILVILGGNNLFELQYATDTYFSERINFTKSDNLSALVYLQGWERAYLGLTTSYGLGVGFQNLGSLELSNSSHVIYSILNRHKNIDDGGFMAAKILGEFGFIGVLFSFGYFILALRAVKYLHRARNISAYEPIRNNVSVYSDRMVKLGVGSALILTFSIEFLIRGVGYFSPGLTMFLVGVFLMKFQNLSDLCDDG